jgi:hypothetical protein
LQQFLMSADRIAQHQVAYCRQRPPRGLGSGPINLLSRRGMV